MSFPRLSRWATPASLAAVALALVYGRFLMEARGAVGAAERASSRGDQAEATRCYLDALRAYVPASPYQRRALDGLGAIAAQASQAGDAEGERRALQAVRTGLLSTRSLYLPFRARLLDADRRLAQLHATVPFPPDPAVIHRRGYGLDPPGTHPLAAAGWTLVALLGCATWVGAVLLLIRRGLEEGPRAPRRGASAASSVVVRVGVPAMFVLGFTLFLVGLRFG